MSPIITKIKIWEIVIVLVWIKVRSGDTSYVGSVKHSHCVLYMHEQIQQGVFVFDVGQGDVIMGCYGKTSMQYPDNLKKRHSFS